MHLEELINLTAIPFKYKPYSKINNSKRSGGVTTLL